MARYWTGQLIWNATGRPKGWSVPPNVLSWLDLRSLPQRAAAGPVPQGNVFLATANSTNLGAGYVLLGQAPAPAGLNLSAAQRTAWRTLFGLPDALGGTTLASALWETLTLQADPTGDNRCMPIDALWTGELELRLGPQVIRSQPFSAADPEAVPLIDMLQRIYRRIRQASLDGISLPTHYRKVLGAWVRKYRLAYRQLQPSDLPDEPPLDPETTLTDDFNTADSDTFGADLTWSEVVGDWDIVSNQGEMVSATGVGSSARAQSDLSSSDHYSQVSLVRNSDSGAGPAARFASGAETYYNAQLYNPDNNIYVQSVVAGTPTNIGNTAITPSLPEIYKLECNGSAIKAYQAGTERVSITDTSITGNTRGGLYAAVVTTPTPQFDNWEAADLAAAGQPTTKRWQGVPHAGGVRHFGAGTRGI